MKNLVWNAFGAFIAIIVATIGPERIGYPFLFWFLGGLIMGVFTYLFLIPTERRNLKTLIVMPILSATAFALVYYLMDKLMSI